MPHMIYGYTGASYAHYGDHIYNVTLGLFWLQYAFNISIYMAQKDQYWKAYKDYITEIILPKFGYELPPVEINFGSKYSLQKLPPSSIIRNAPNTSYH